MILLDTDALSFILRPPVPPPLEEILRATALEARFTSAINIGELVYGAQRGPRTERHMEALRTTILPGVTVLPFDQKAAIVYGIVRADLERRGQSIGEADLRIASVALVNRLLMVTGNVRHFARVSGLRVEDIRAA